MYKIQVENDCLAECLKLGKLQYEEIEKKAKAVPYSGNFAMLRAAMDSGMMYVVTARDESGKMVGYFANIVSEDFLTAGKTSKEVAIYVIKEHRGNGVFELMLDLVEEVAVSMGSHQQLLSFKDGKNEQLGLKVGYVRSEVVYEKMIGV